MFRRLLPSRARAHNAGYLHHNLPARLPNNTLRVLWLTIENQSTKSWQRDPEDGRSTDLTVTLDHCYLTTLKLPTPEIRPGERVTLFWQFRTPASPGRHELQFDLVEQNVTLFSQQGVAPLLLSFEVYEANASESSRLMDWAFEANSWFSLPSQGVSWSCDGPPYPLFAREARGCRITDLEGRQYIDYVMGWGSALLGYAHPRIQQAVAEALSSAAILSLPHHLELEVTRLLREMVPCAEMALFGKNGSDVCTAAVRLARIYTGRKKILFSGYHGWQDWYAETRGFAETGLPERDEPLVIPFPVHDGESLSNLLKVHQGQVAAVMLEPAAAVEGINGPVRDADTGFLRDSAALCRREGAVLIFDEIMTGFRYREGSVQRATGVVPDLTCLGKALSAGMPLSALVGRKEVFQVGMERIYYGPTFKCEVYSFAAARAALTVYREGDVPGHVWRYGTQLQHAVNQICRQAKVPMEMSGPPFRMVLACHDPDQHRAMLMRTLLQQELLKRRVLTYRGFLLPSLAHDREAMQQTCEAYEHGIATVKQALTRNTFAPYLEIPPVQ